MRKSLKKFLTTAFCALTVVATALGVNALSTDVAVANAESDLSKLVIEKKSLNVAENVNVVFYVPVEAGAKNDIKVHVTEKEKGGDVQVELSAAAEDYKEGDVSKYYRFIYRGVTAYQLENELIAYAQLGENKSPEIKYSVLQYAYSKLGKTGKAKDTTEGLEDLLNAMLAYGTASAKFAADMPADFSYEDSYTYVSLTNATLEDGFTYGLYEKGAEIAVIPNEGYILGDGANGAFQMDGETVKLTVPNDTLVDADSFVENANISAAEMIAYEKENLALDFTAAKAGDVKALPTETQAYEDVIITWGAENADVNGNEVTFTTVGDIDLVATFTCGEEIDTRVFSISVEMNDAQKVAAAKEALVYERTSALQDEQDTLPTVDVDGVTISWSATGAASVSGGKVTFTNNGTATLKVTITCGTATDSLTWEITVKGYQYADFDTVKSTSTSYGSSTTERGWKAANAAVLSGGASNSSPKFSFIDTSESVRAFCLNGKTSAKGTITSPTLTGGISRLTFNYGLPFSDTKIGLKVEIQQNGATVASDTISNTSATKLTKYSYVWELDEAVEGDFTIVISNTAPSNNTGNKDRTAIWMLGWLGA